MDILRKRLLKVDENCYFLRASVDEPFVYLRFSGVVMRQYTNNELVSYHVKIDKVLESKDVVSKFMNRKRFRIFDNNNSRTYNKQFYVFDVLDSFSFESAFRNKYKDCYIDIHSSLVFESESEMLESRNDIDQHLIHKLTDTLTILKQHGNQR